MCWVSHWTMQCKAEAEQEVNLCCRLGRRGRLRPAPAARLAEQSSIALLLQAHGAPCRVLAQKAAQANAWSAGPAAEKLGEAVLGPATLESMRRCLPVAAHYSA